MYITPENHIEDTSSSHETEVMFDEMYPDREDVEALGDDVRVGPRRVFKGAIGWKTERDEKASSSVRLFFCFSVFFLFFCFSVFPGKVGVFRMSHVHSRAPHPSHVTSGTWSWCGVRETFCRLQPHPQKQKNRKTGQKILTRPVRYYKGG